MKKRIINLFLIFLITQSVFAMVYYLLYQNDNSHFLFLEQIINKQTELVEKRIENEISDLENEFQRLQNDSIGVFSFVNGFKYYAKTIENLKSQNFISNLDGFSITMKTDTIIDFTIDSTFTKIESTRRTFNKTDYFLSVSSYNSKPPYNLIFNSKYPIYPEEYKKLKGDSLKLYFSNLLYDRANNFQKRYENRFKSLSQKKTIKTERLTEVKELKKNVWGYWDFLYFSFTKVGNSDILPNSTTCRSIATVQNIIDLFLIGFLLTLISVRKK